MIEQRHSPEGSILFAGALAGAGVIAENVIVFTRTDSQVAQGVILGVVATGVVFAAKELVLYSRYIRREVSELRSEYLKRQALTVSTPGFIEAEYQITSGEQTFAL